MHCVIPKTLLERLLDSARLWSEANGRTLGALASIVVNHGSFFDRLEAPKASTTTVTLEKFARFLADPANWPEGEVPQEVKAFVHVTGITANPDDVPTGQCAGLSGDQRGAA